MNNKTILKVAGAVIGLGSIVAGFVVGKIQEKRLEKECKELEKMHDYLSDFSSRLDLATERYTTEVNQACTEADAILERVETEEESDN